MSLLSAEEIGLLGRAPVPGDNPAGSNIRLERAFESIEQEIAKLDSLTDDDPVRWSGVQETARQILQEQSKDILVACYLARALCEIDVLQGLTQGLAVTRGLVEVHWDHAYPPRKRMRGRAQAFDWLMESCLPLLEQYAGRVSELEQIKALELESTALDELLVEKMSHHAPNLVEVRHCLRRLRQGLEVESQKQQSPSRPQASPSVVNGATAAISPAPAIGGAGSVGSDRDLTAVYRLCQDQLLNASGYLNAKNIFDPDAFRINRFITWLGVNQLPPVTANKTQLRPVSKAKMDVINALSQEKRWVDLVREMEPSLVKAPFWLTGQRLVYEALEELDAQIVLDAIRPAIRAFIKKLPDVVNLTFNDDTPFADEMTRQWVQRLEPEKGVAQPSGALTVDSQDLNPEWESSYLRATEMAAEKKKREALDLFQAGVLQSASRREQALWRFNQARFCFEQGLQDLAYPLLKALDEELQKRGVEDWEPQLSKRVLELLLRIRMSMASVEHNFADIEQMHSRLCQLDLALAFELSSQ